MFISLILEQIDRVENNVESIHANLDKSNRLLRGIESFPGAVVNSLTKDKTGREPTEVKDRTVIFTQCTVLFVKI